MKRRFSLRSKLAIFILTIVVVTGTAIGALGLVIARTALVNAAVAQLETVRQIKANEISRYFRDRVVGLQVYATNSAVRQAFDRFDRAFRDEGGTGGRRWSEWDAFHGPKLQVYIEQYGYLDLFFVDLDGNVIYSVSQNTELGQNLRTGELAETGLAVAGMADGGLAVADFSWYSVSSRPAAFISYPVEDLDGEPLGRLVYELSLTMINTIMQERTGLGETGETYLVGADRLMRSDSVLARDTHTVTASFRNPETGTVDTAPVRSAFSGEWGTGRAIDYRGERVLASWAPLDLPQLEWAIIAEKDEAEALAAVRRLVLWVIVVGVVAMVIAFVAATGIARRLARSVRGAAAAANVIATGNLSRPVTRTSNDELGDLARSLDTMRRKLADLVAGITARSRTLDEVGGELSANMVQTSAAIQEMTANVSSIESQISNQNAAVGSAAAAIEQIARSIESLDGAVQKQSTAVTESSSAIEEMIANVQSIADNMNAVVRDVDELREAGETGNAAVSNMGTRVQAIADQSSTLQSLNGVIADIAARTNLLAMNAAIEAAHAGDAGRGFGVVAAEIRTLAENVTAQSRNVADSLKTIQQMIRDMVSDSDATTEAFSAVFARVGRVRDVSDEINSALTEQSAGSSEVLGALKEITEITAEVQNGSGEMRTGSAQIQEATEHLEQISAAVLGGISEVSTGIAEINRAVENVNQLGYTNRDEIAAIADRLGQFELPDESEEEVLGDDTNGNSDEPSSGFGSAAS